MRHDNRRSVAPRRWAWSGKDLNIEDYPLSFPSTALDPDNLNLNGPQQELLLWHQRLGHRNLPFIQRLLSQPRDEHGQQVIVPRLKQSSSCDIPPCEACIYAKMHDHTRYCRSDPLFDPLRDGSPAVGLERCRIRF